MENILFRGKRIDNGEWTFGYYGHIDCNEESFIFFWGKNGYHVHQIDDKTIGQFTGKKDSLDRKIYEGDIINIKNNNKLETVVIKREDSEWIPLSKFYEKDLGFKVDDCKIVGNKYDNQYLLKEKSVLCI